MVLFIYILLTFNTMSEARASLVEAIFAPASVNLESGKLEFLPAPDSTTTLNPYFTNLNNRKYEKKNFFRSIKKTVCIMIIYIPIKLLPPFSKILRKL